MYYFDCKFLIKKDGTKRGKRLKNCLEAKQYGAIASPSEVAAIASDIALDKYKFEFITKRIKKVYLSFKYEGPEVYGVLNIEPCKNQTPTEADLKDIKHQFETLPEWRSQVHNYVVRETKESWKLYLDIVRESLRDTK